MCADNCNKFIFKIAISILVISNHNSFRVLLFDKIVSVYFISEICFFILALEMASPWNQHCANCIGTLSFPRRAHQYAALPYRERSKQVAQLSPRDRAMRRVS